MTTAMVELLPEVSTFLAKPLQQPWVGGKEMIASDGASFETHDPGSGEKLGSVPHFNTGDVDAAVSAAQHAFAKSGWAN